MNCKCMTLHTYTFIHPVHTQRVRTSINSENVMDGSLDETPWPLLKMIPSLRKDTLLLVCGIICPSKMFLKTEEKAFVGLS